MVSSASVSSCTWKVRELGWTLETAAGFAFLSSGDTLNCKLLKPICHDGHGRPENQQSSTEAQGKEEGTKTDRVPAILVLHLPMEIVQDIPGAPCSHAGYLPRLRGRSLRWVRDDLGRSKLRRRQQLGLVLAKRCGSRRHVVMPGQMVSERLKDVIQSLGVIHSMCRHVRVTAPSGCQKLRIEATGGAFAALTEDGDVAPWTVAVERELQKMWQSAFLCRFTCHGFLKHRPSVCSERQPAFKSFLLRLQPLLLPQPQKRCSGNLGHGASWG